MFCNKCGKENSDDASFCSDCGNLTKVGLNETKNKLAKEGNSIGMKFTYIPAGEFIMGSDEEENEQPMHKVTINEPFYLGSYPVTQREWMAVMGNNPSNFQDDNRPVNFVSWVDVQKFIRKLNKKERTCTYRLPSEAEWEYAARAGSKKKYCYGDSESNLRNYAWYGGNSHSNIHPVGKKKPNSFGIYDMHGNVWDWVQDEWHNNYNGAPTDGNIWDSGMGSQRVARGGSYPAGSREGQAAARLNVYRPLDNLSFRLLKEL